MSVLQYRTGEYRTPDRFYIVKLIEVCFTAINFYPLTLPKFLTGTFRLCYEIDLLFSPENDCPVRIIVAYGRIDPEPEREFEKELKVLAAQGLPLKQVRYSPYGLNLIFLIAVEVEFHKFSVFL